MRIALFGGSFDPPHRGHLAIALAAANRFGLDKILFAPTGLQPLKPAGAAAPFADRLAMVELLCAAHECFEASSLDAPEVDGKPNYTIDTLHRLRETLEPESEVFVVVGADSFLDLRRWRAPDALLESAEWIVVSRPGFSLTQLQTLALTTSQRAHVHLLEDVEVPVSATAVRECLRTRGECADLVPQPILAYIQDHGLYSAI